MAKLVDAIHILNTAAITRVDFDKANQHLLLFVNEFSELYGDSNMTFNVHQLKHIPECVKQNGPLFLYSNYSMEDYIGYLVSLSHGTTDVSQQICEKYLLEKELIGHLEKSPLAKCFYDKIQSKLKFSQVKKVDGSIVIGKTKQISTEQDFSLIREKLNLDIGVQIDEYDSILWNGDIFYERRNDATKKRTDDTIVFNTESGEFAEIKSILVVNEQVFFLINEKYQVSVNMENTSEYVTFLSAIDCLQPKIITSSAIGHKFALIAFSNVLACSKFPNFYERH